MIGAIAVLAAGVALFVLPIVLRKKLAKQWMASLMAGGVLLGVSGGFLTAGEVRQDLENRENLYTSLCYLGQYNTDSALFYLDKAGTDTYVGASARSLLERMRENDLMARLYVDIAASEARSDEQKSLLTTLQAVDTHQWDQLNLVVSELTKELKLSEERKTDVQAFVAAETGGATEGVSDRLDETARRRLSVGAMLNQGNYSGAVREAALLADADSNADNRLLLAETMAESAYNGVTLSAEIFAPMDAEKVDQSVRKERDKLALEIIDLQSELQKLEISINGTQKEEELQKLNAQKLELTEQVNALTARSDKLFVYRAFSAIADIRTLEAELVRARLHFALEDQDTAVDTLLEAAQSLGAKLTSDHTLANSLRIVKEAYATENPHLDNQEFRDAVTQLLAAPFSDLVHVRQSDLTVDFMEKVVSDQKVYGESLFVSGLDTRDYPTVRVTLSGREEVLEKVVAGGEDIAARDTRNDVTYTAKITEQPLTSISVVVDVSGSMGGRPMASLKEALVSFVQNADEDTEISLSAFESSARKLTDLTKDKSLLLTQVNALGGGGGTNITSGIVVGTETLTNAAGMRYMLLMTDGQSSIDFNTVDAAAAQGITIHTIGFGSVNDSLLEEIAQRTGGQYVKADSVSELSNVYASLQQLLGNTVTVEYTVTDDADQRYFFLQLGDYSLRKDYIVGSNTAATKLLTCNPSVVTEQDLQRYKDRNAVLELNFTGEDLSRVTAVTVGGQTAAIVHQQADSLRVSLQPELTAGWQTVTLRLEDGSERSYDRLLLVGESKTYRNVRLGCITVQQAAGVLPGDGTLVLTGSNIQLGGTDANGAQLALTMNGTLTLPWNIPDPAEGETLPTSDIDMGESGVMEGWGRLSLRSDDSAYDRNGPAVLAEGGIRLECESGQCRLVSATEGGEQ